MFQHIDNRFKKTRTVRDSYFSEAIPILCIRAKVDNRDTCSILKKKPNQIGNDKVDSSLKFWIVWTPCLLQQVQGLGKVTNLEKKIFSPFLVQDLGLQASSLDLHEHRRSHWHTCPMHLCRNELPLRYFIVFSKHWESGRTMSK